MSFLSALLGSSTQTTQVADSPKMETPTMDVVVETPVDVNAKQETTPAETLVETKQETTPAETSAETKQETTPAETSPDIAVTRIVIDTKTGERKEENFSFKTPEEMFDFLSKQTSESSQEDSDETKPFASFDNMLKFLSTGKCPCSKCEAKRNQTSPTTPAETTTKATTETKDTPTNELTTNEPTTSPDNTNKNTQSLSSLLEKLLGSVSPKVDADDPATYNQLPSVGNKQRETFIPLLRSDVSINNPKSVPIGMSGEFYARQYSDVYTLEAAEQLDFANWVNADFLKALLADATPEAKLSPNARVEFSSTAYVRNRNTRQNVWAPVFAKALKSYLTQTYGDSIERVVVFDKDSLAYTVCTC